MSNFCFLGPQLSIHKTRCLVSWSTSYKINFSKQLAMSSSFLPATHWRHNITIDFPFLLPIGEKLSLYAHIRCVNTTDFTPAISGIAFSLFEGLPNRSKFFHHCFFQTASYLGRNIALIRFSFVRVLHILHSHHIL